MSAFYSISYAFNARCCVFIDIRGFVPFNTPIKELIPAQINYPFYLKFFFDLNSPKLEFPLEKVSLPLTASLSSLDFSGCDDASDSGCSSWLQAPPTSKQSPVDMEKYARNLPRHLIAVIMDWEMDKSTFKYLLCGILLLHSMIHLASRVPKIEQILLDDVKISEQLIDLVFYLLVLLGPYRHESHTIPNGMVLLHSALVVCIIKLFLHTTKRLLKH
ncbi:uncharacterized protein LOC121787365 [Salvia splendens]|uniref:uncharacterized protein LOC121787365 n=1 Tax=Salvia splendens TaxID=180675 RepID=UPI001C266254|nr:uncharacterized protein LOC121787365 [Salvia splendens]